MTPSPAVSSPCFVSRLISHLREPLFWNGYALIFSSTATSALGLIYWGIAARTYSAHIVGVNTAAMSGMQLLSLLSQLGMVNVANRFVPTAGRATAKLVLVGYALALTLAFITSVVFVIGIDWWAPSLHFIHGDAQLAGWFIGSTMGWVIFVIQDAVLVGLRQATWVPIENVIFAVSKIALLVVFATLIPQYGVFASWVIPSIVIVIPTNIFIFGILIPRHVRITAGKSMRLKVGEIARFIAGNYTSTLIWNATVSVLPLIVIAVVGAEVSAYFYLPWTIAFALHMVSTNMNMSFLTEVATDASRLATYSYRTWLQTMRLLVPAVIIIELTAPYILAIFGGNYAAEGATLLRLLTLATLSYSFTDHFLEIARAQQRNRAAVIVQTVLCSMILVLGSIMLHFWGITGLGVAWFIAQTSVGLFLATTQLGNMWLPQVNLAALGKLLQLARTSAWRLRNRKTNADVLNLVPGLLNNVKVAGDMPSPAAWTEFHILPTTTDMTVVTLGSADAPAVALLKLPRTDAAWQNYLTQLRVLSALRENPNLQGFSRLLPFVIASGSYANRRYAIEQMLAGVDTLPLLGDPSKFATLLAVAAEAIKELHQATAEIKTVDSTLLGKWVDARLDILSQVYRKRKPGLVSSAVLRKLRDQMHDELTGHTVTVSWIHGDYWPGNLRTTPDGAQIAGILDWELASANELPMLDVMLLIITFRMAVDRLGMGDVIRRLLLDESWLPCESAILLQARRDYSTDSISNRTLILLTWLRHVSDELLKSSHLATHWLWLAKNIEEVLLSV